MMLGLGWLLPLGVLSARYMKHRPDSFWFTLHKYFQLSGVLVAIIGFSIAVKNFDVFHDDHSRTSYQHGVMGVVTFTLVLLQPLVAFMRPHKPEGEPAQVSVSVNRYWWEMAHKSCGYLILLLAFVTIILGAKMEGTNWVCAYIFGVVGSLLVLMGLMWFDRFSYQPPVDVVTSDVV